MTKVFSILLLFVVFATSCTDQKEEEKNVRATFDGYKTAILNDKGEEAVGYVDSRTVDYYTNMLELTKNGDREKVDALPLIDKLMVFSVRARVPKDDILSFDGKKLLVYAIESGMVGKESVQNVTIGDVKIDGDSAKGQFIVSGQEAPFYFDFYKEDGQWKLDLTSLFSTSASALEQMVQSSGMTENEYVFAVLEALTGKKPGEDIWNTVQ